MVKWTKQNLYKKALQKNCSEKFCIIIRNTRLPESLSLQSSMLLKKRLWYGCFPGIFFRILFILFQNTSGRPLLYHVVRLLGYKCSRRSCFEKLFGQMLVAKTFLSKDSFLSMTTEKVFHRGCFDRTTILWGTFGWLFGKDL